MSQVASSASAAAAASLSLPPLPLADSSFASQSHPAASLAIDMSQPESTPSASQAAPAGLVVSSRDVFLHTLRDAGFDLAQALAEIGESTNEHMRMGADDGHE